METIKISQQSLDNFSHDKNVEGIEQEEIKATKSYAVDVDFTFSKVFHVEAQSEEEARQKVEQLIKENHYTHKGDCYVCHSITDVYED